MRDVLSLCAFAVTLLSFVVFVVMLKPDVIRTATSPQHATSIISAFSVPSAADFFELRIRIKSRFVPS